MSLLPVPPLIITPGEPAGIGTEISLKAWQAGMKNICLMGDPGVAKSQLLKHMVQLAPRFVDTSAPVLTSQQCLVQGCLYDGAWK